MSIRTKDLLTYASACAFALAIAGCSYSAQMVNDKGVTVNCVSNGVGPITGMAAKSNYDACVAKYKALGYHEVTAP
jgi:hypothetical protein